jgi:hypothetical protein
VGVRFRPPHFPPSLANASQLDLQLTSGVTLVNVGEYWPWFTRSLVRMTGFDDERLQLIPSLGAVKHAIGSTQRSAVVNYKGVSRFDQSG